MSLDPRILHRWRPVAVVVTAVILLTVFPGSGDGADEVDASDSGAGPAAAVANGDTAATDLEAAPGADGPDATAAPGATVGAAGVAGPATAAPPAATARPTGAGLNSPEALATPECDPSTKRLRISFSRAAPCAVPWPEGADNGGATWQGVTAKEIKVVIYNPPNDPTVPPIGGGDPAALKRDWEFQSKPYEHFYRQWGRKVVYEVFSGTGNDEVAQRADAIKIANMKPFATVQITSGNTVLISELAGRGVIAIANSGVSQALAQKVRPYVWGASVQPAEQVAINAAHYVARRLNGHPAKWSGDPAMQARPRSFGVLQTSDLDQELFTREFAALGGRVADRQTYAYGAANVNAWLEQSRTIVSRMKAKGVTSVVAIADFLFLGIVTKEATNQAWFPEWITTGLLGNDIDVMAKTFDQAQWSHAFGTGTLYAGNNIPAPQFHFQGWYHGSSYDAINMTGLGGDETPLLFGGIHGAGPKLTPETFRDGAFAIAPSGGAVDGGLITMVWSFGRWGYYPGDDYNGFDDFTEIWWDVDGRGRDGLLGNEVVGLYRYVNRGKRYFFNQWPAGEPPMFDERGIAPYYTEPPTPGDRQPDYPCPGCPSAGG